MTDRPMKDKWSKADRQRFADGDRVRAHARPGRRHDGPTADEWDEVPGQAYCLDLDEADNK